MTNETKARITDVRTVSVPVSDQERALDFYQSKLGLEKRLDATFGVGRRWIEVAPPGSQTTLALVPPGPGERAGIDTGIRLTTSDAEAEYADLKARGVDVDPEITRWPGVPPMFGLRDPDGNILRLIEQTAA